MKVDKVWVTPDDGDYFFGYYDKSPLNKDNTKLLACKVKFIDRMPTKDDVLEIGYFEWQKSNKFIKVAETRAWNWQQGCMLQWFAPEYDKKIIYNDRIDDQFVTVIVDIESGKKELLPMAYYAMSKDGDFVLCIDNERHYWYRKGYHYEGLENINKKKPIDENDGIWSIDVKTKKKKQIVSQKELLNIKPLSNMSDTIHYVEHLMISPDNKRFCFLHRWLMDDGGIYSRLYTAGIDGSNIYLLNDSGRMSHFCWRNEKELLGFGGIENPVNRIRKYKSLIKFFIKPLLPLYHKIADKSKIRELITGDSYILFEDLTNNKSSIAVETLKEDGHPTFHPSNINLFVSDTYTQEDLHRELFLFDMVQNKKLLIDRLYSIPEFDNSGIRCDLHPKWNLDGKYICIDTTHNRKREMFLYEVKL